MKTVMILLSVMMLFMACNAKEETAVQEEPTAQEEAAAAEEGPNPLQVRLMEAGFQVFKQRVEAPAFTLPGVDGESISLDSFEGKTVLLNFWATWCPPCRAEMPSMQRMYDELEDEGVVLVAVNLQEPENTVKSFLEENGYTFPVLLDITGGVGALYGARSIPQTYLIDTEGYAVASVTGSREWDTAQLYDVLRSMVSGS